jgi:raffinose/stachyose/melibiose transport system substrate-binding protein
VNLEKIFNAIGIGLLVLCICLSLFRVLTRERHERASNQTVIRLAHWQLEGGVRDAFQKVADEYTKMHPNVKVEQMLVPERIYPNWATTQLVGGTAPDIVELGKGADTGDRVARFFLPSTDVADKPNPYNAGTPLEGVAWRSTFVDGMEGVYREDLADYYGIPTFLITIRLYYNKDLMREITGGDQVPTTYNELTQLCDKVVEFAHRPENLKRKLIPLAGSKYNAPMLMDRLANSQTQKFDPMLNDMPILARSPEDAALNYLKGKWSLNSEEIRSGLELQRDLGRFMPPGFLQLGREDATLYFVQERALMVATGSWDASSIFMLADQTGFEVGAFQVPLPDTNHPKYGKNVMGLASEANNKSTGAMAVFRGSKNIDVAIDFLQFLTSLRGNSMWSDISKWPPVIVGVQPNERTKPFMPIAEGEIDGMNLKVIGGSTSQVRLIDNNIGALMDPNGSVDGFINKIEPEYGKAQIADLKEASKNRLRSIRRQDGNIVSVEFAKSQDPTGERVNLKHGSLWENQLAQEMLNMHVAYELKAVEAGAYKLPAAK